MLCLDNRVEVRLCYPWKPSVRIYYTIQAVSERDILHECGDVCVCVCDVVLKAWPLSLQQEELQFSTSYKGPYSFVHDVLSDHASSAITAYRYTL